MKKYPQLKTTIFWSGMVSSILIFLQSMASLIGLELSAEAMTTILAAVNSVLALLAMSGILVNPEKIESFQQLKNHRMLKKKDSDE